MTRSPYIFYIFFVENDPVDRAALAQLRALHAAPPGAVAPGAGGVSGSGSGAPKIVALAPNNTPWDSAAETLAATRKELAEFSFDAVYFAPLTTEIVKECVVRFLDKPRCSSDSRGVR